MQLVQSDRDEKNVYATEESKIGKNSLKQRFSTGVLEFLKHAITEYLVRGTDLFSLRLSKNKDNGRHNNSRLV